MNVKITNSSEIQEKFITESLRAFNCKNFHLSMEESYILLNYHLSNSDDDVIAGVNAILIAKSSVYVDMLWVDEKYRGFDYGTMLLKHVENQAKKLGAIMIHLDTYDFQAKGFYLKCGYEEYAVLDDSPSIGHKRFYLKKKI